MLFKRDRQFKKKQKVYITRLAEYGRVEDFKNGLIKVKTFRTRKEIWIVPGEIENGE